MDHDGPIRWTDLINETFDVTDRQTPETNMETPVSDILVGLMMTILGLVGLFLAAGAIDDGIYIFGISLAGFAVIFIFGLVRCHYDRRDAMRQRGSHYV